MMAIPSDFTVRVSPMAQGDVARLAAENPALARGARAEGLAHRPQEERTVQHTDVERIALDVANYRNLIAGKHTT